MEYKIYNREKTFKEIKKLFELLENDNIDTALGRIEYLKNHTSLFKNLTTYKTYIQQYAEEKKRIMEMEKTNPSLKECLNNGVLSLYYEDFENALINLEAGAYISDEPIFLFYLGVLNFEIWKYGVAENYFNRYKTLGAVKLEECLEYLIKTYEKKIEKYSDSNNKGDINAIKTYNNKIKQTKKEIIELKKFKSGMINGYQKQEDIDINYEDELEIKELISNGKINDVIDCFNESDTEKKINIIALLYINGFEKSADKLVKQNKEELKNYEPQRYNKLLREKTLYLAKSKRGK